MTALAEFAGPSRWWHSRAVRRFMSHRLALLGVVMITALTLACAIGPYLLPYDMLHIDIRGRFSPPLTGDHISAPIRWGATSRRASSWRGGSRSGGLLRHAALDADRDACRRDRRLSRRLDRRGADAHGRRLPVLSVDLPAAGAGRGAEAEPDDGRRHHRPHQLDGGRPDRRGRGPLARNASSCRPAACWD